MEKGSSARRLVLVVDGDARTTRVLARMLREDGFDVDVALDGAAAIGRLSTRPLPDVVVTDLATGHASGLAVARYARSLRADLPVVFVTEHAELVHGERGLLPAPQIFSKPLDYAAFSRALAHVLAGPASDAAT